jgi:hypothetical protein
MRKIITINYTTMTIADFCSSNGESVYNSRKIDSAVDLINTCCELYASGEYVMTTEYRKDSEGSDILHIVTFTQEYS